jgi:hypothetical protein
MIGCHSGLAFFFGILLATGVWLFFWDIAVHREVKDRMAKGTISAKK